MLLRISVQNEIPFTYGRAALWYASADHMKFIHRDVHKHFVLPLKETRQVALSEADQQQGRFVAVDTLALPVGQTRESWLAEVPFALLLTKEVFTNKDGSTGVRYLVTDDLTLPYDQIITLYQRRWSIEVYHESLKQNASLEKSPTRTETTQRHHFFASVCAYVKLESLKTKTGMNHFALKSKIYLAALKTAYQELIKLEPISLGA